MSAALKQLKQTQGFQSLLVLDSKGFQIHNNGFSESHNLHALHQLSDYFFPGETKLTVVGIETVKATVLMRKDKEGRLIAFREAKTVTE